MSKLWMPMLLMGGCLSVALGAAELKDVPDPTRPAAGFRASGASHGSKQAEGAAAAGAASAAEPARPQLQGIRMDLLGGKPVAMIGDELVSVGDRVGSATVVSITRSEVMLRDQRGLHKMQIDDGVSVAPASDGPPRGATRRKGAPISGTQKADAASVDATPEEARKPALKKSRRKETS